MNIISVENLTKKFDDLTAVNAISFDVHESTIFGFLGPNGAGKTTTIRMLTTLQNPTSGVAELAGYDIARHKPQVRANIGIVFQEPTLDDQLTAEENLIFHGWLYGERGSVLRERIDSLLKLMELYERRKDKVENFSGGMKRRLEIARGLVHKPKVLFLDEPTVGLDPQTRNKIWDYVKKLKDEEKVTIFMTTHYLDEAEYCDRIAIIDKGKIIIAGSPRELKQKTGKESLNEVFLDLTGRDIRDENVSQSEKMRRGFKRGISH